MPAYFYHLAFELRNKLPSESDLGPIESPASEVFTPPRNFNIFENTLPTHRSFAWASYIAPRRRTGPSPTGTLSRENSLSKSVRSRLLPPQKSAKGSGECDSENYEVGRVEHDDWRTADIIIEAVDMKGQQDHQELLEDTDPSRGAGGFQLTASGLATKGKYIPSNPRSTDLGYGVVHLYRDQEPANLLYEEDGVEAVTNTFNFEADKAYIDNECTTLCILAVPSYMTPSDLLGWVGEETRAQVSHFRLVRTGRSNRYMVLMKFRKSEEAKQWQRAWNGKLFNIMEPENCHVVFVKSIRFQLADSARDLSSFPDMSNDPFTPSARVRSESDLSDVTTVTPEQASKPSGNLSTKPAPPPTPSLLELPTCPVCLERMDETTGLATIFCQHVFHCACLQKWRGSGCPVCRYTQSELSAKSGAHEGLQNECNICHATENLWICLICGHVGCGRYDEAHAYAHFEHTNHTFAMDISTQHIWDYCGDEYVHRLIQNKADGKLVELPRFRPEVRDVDDVSIDKIESMSQEYTQLLQSQLDSQRTYFEEQVERAVDKASKASAAAEQAAERAVQAYSRLEALEASNYSFTQDTLPSLERDKERAERRAEKLEGTTRRLQKEWRETRVINESLMNRITHLEKQLEEATLKNGELEEQNRDLSFFISGMEKLKDQGEEIKEGTVSVPDAPTTGNRKKKKNKSKT